MRYYCTGFDSVYLDRGLALHESLEMHGGDFELTVICLDEEVERVLQRSKLKRLKIVALAKVEAVYPELAEAKENRSRIEYYFTLTSHYIHHELMTNPGVDLLTYLDADMYFFSSPEPLFDEMAGAGIAIIAHRFLPQHSMRLQYGIYNVGWLSFRREKEAEVCLSDWRERCVEWCYDRAEAGRFADQKYLDTWPEQFANVCVLKHPGAGVAPWNVAGSKLSVMEGIPYCNGQPLLFYHFEGLSRTAPGFFNPSLAESDCLGQQARDVGRLIYKPYLRCLARKDRLRSKLATERVFTIRRPQPPTRSWRQKARLLLDCLGKWCRGEYFAVLAGRLILPPSLYSMKSRVMKNSSTCPAE